MRIIFTEHGIRRVMERRVVFTRSCAILLIQMAWRDGRTADYNVFEDQWMDHIFLYYDGADQCTLLKHRHHAFPLRDVVFQL